MHDAYFSSAKFLILNVFSQVYLFVLAIITWSSLATDSWWELVCSWLSLIFGSPASFFKVIEWWVQQNQDLTVERHELSDKSFFFFFFTILFWDLLVKQFLIFIMCATLIFYYTVYLIRMCCTNKSKCITVL